MIGRSIPDTVMYDGFILRPLSSWEIQKSQRRGSCWWDKTFEVPEFSPSWQFTNLNGANLIQFLRCSAGVQYLRDCNVFHASTLRYKDSTVCFLKSGFRRCANENFYHPKPYQCFYLFIWPKLISRMEILTEIPSVGIPKTTLLNLFSKILAKWKTK